MGSSLNGLLDSNMYLPPTVDSWFRDGGELKQAPILLKNYNLYLNTINDIHINKCIFDKNKTNDISDESDNFSTINFKEDDWIDTSLETNNFGLWSSIDIRRRNSILSHTRTILEIVKSYLLTSTCMTYIKQSFNISPIFIFYSLIQPWTKNKANLSFYSYLQDESVRLEFCNSEVEKTHISFKKDPLYRINLWENCVFLNGLLSHFRWLELYLNDNGFKFHAEILNLIDEIIELTMIADIVIDTMSIRKLLDEYETKNLIELVSSDLPWFRSLNTLFGFCTGIVNMDKFIIEVKAWVSNKDTIYLPNISTYTFNSISDRYITSINPQFIDYTLIDEKFFSPGASMREKMDKVRVSKSLLILLDSKDRVTSWRTDFYNKKLFFANALPKYELTKTRPFINCDNTLYFGLSQWLSIIYKVYHTSMPFYYAKFNKIKKGEYLRSVLDKLKSNRYYAFPIDQYRFDQHISLRIIKMLITYFKNRILNDTTNPEEFILLSNQLEYALDHTLLKDTVGKNEFIVEGGLLSGWKTTSFWGSMINFISISYLLEVTGIHQTEFELVTMGDDSSLLLEKNNITKDDQFGPNFVKLAETNGIIIKWSQNYKLDTHSDFLRTTFSVAYGDYCLPSRLIPTLLYNKPTSVITNNETMGLENNCQTLYNLSSRYKVVNRSIWKMFLDVSYQLTTRENSLYIAENYPFIKFKYRHFNNPEIEKLFDNYANSSYFISNLVNLLDTHICSCIPGKTVYKNTWKPSIISTLRQMFSTKYSISWFDRSCISEKNVIHKNVKNRLLRSIDVPDVWQLYNRDFDVPNVKHITIITTESYLLDSIIGKLSDKLFSWNEKTMIVNSFSEYQNAYNHIYSKLEFEYYTGQKRLPSIKSYVSQIENGAVNRRIDNWILTYLRSAPFIVKNLSKFELRVFKYKFVQREIQHEVRLRTVLRAI